MKKGFTLTELLTVVLIIGILTAVALPKYSRSVEHSRATEAMANLQVLNEAVYAYAAGRSGESECPVSFRKLVISVPGEACGTNTKFWKGNNFIYELGGTDVLIPGTNCKGVLATRYAPGKFNYKIWNPYLANHSGKGTSLACYGANQADQDICDSLQIKSQTPPNSAS